MKHICAPNFRLLFLLLLTILLLVPDVCSADWENGLGIALDRAVDRWYFRLTWIAGINLFVAFVNILLRKKLITYINYVLLLPQWFLVFIGFLRSAESGVIALLLMFFTVAHLFLTSKLVAKK